MCLGSPYNHSVNAINSISPTLSREIPYNSTCLNTRGALLVGSIKLYYNYSVQNGVMYLMPFKWGKLVLMRKFVKKIYFYYYGYNNVF